MSKEAGEAVSEKAETEREEPTPKSMKELVEAIKRVEKQLEKVQSSISSWFVTTWIGIGIIWTIILFMWFR